MTEHSHDEHRPRADQDPSSQQAPTAMGQFYPLHDILAVVDDRVAGERAVQALRAAGFAADDVDLLDGEWFVEAMRGVNRHGNLAERLMALLPTDERKLVELYEREARQGHFIVVVHAPEPKDVGRAQQVLRRHGAREMVHYGTAVMTRL
jgi:hypothetical protein